MEEYITFEITQKLKEKGFEIQEEIKYFYYNEELVKVNSYWNIYPYKHAPTISQVLKWLRDEKNIHIEIYTNASGYNYIISDTPKLGGSDKYWSDYEGPNDSGCWDFYEEAAIAGIEYVLDKELIKL